MTRAFSITPLTARTALSGLMRMIGISVRTLWPAQLAVIVLSAGMVAATARGIEGLYPTEADRAQYAATVGVSTVNIAFNGRGYDLTSLGGITAFEIGITGQLLYPLVGMILAIHLTRRQEEAGRIELLTAGRLGALTPLGAGIVLVVADAAIAGALIAAAMIVVGLPGAGAAWYGAGAAACIIFFGALGLLLGQLCQSARTAYLAGACAVTAVFLVRAVLDGMDVDLTWISPLGWLPEIRAFGAAGQRRAWPLIAYGAGFLLLVAVSGTLALRRDLGDGLLAPRPGPARAHRGLATGIGLTWRQCRSAVTVWGVLAVSWALAMGLMSKEVTELVDANPAILRSMGLERGTDLLVMMAAVVSASAAAAVGVQAGTRLAGEESSGRLGAVLSTRLPRERLWGAWWTTAVFASLAVMAISSLTLGVSTWCVSGERAALRTALTVGVGYATPVVLMTAVCAALCALGPRWTALGWLPVGWCFTVGFLGEALRLPQWSRDLSPLHLVGTLPVDDPDRTAVIGLGLASVVLLAGSVAAFRRRDLRAG